MPRFFLLSFLLLVVVVFANDARADLCSYYKEYQPFLYDLVCHNGSGSVRPAGAGSTFSNAFNMNAASLPTDQSSYGLESIGSSVRTSPGNLGGDYALIKGYHRFGTGISTSSDNTFYGNDIYARLHDSSDVQSLKPEEPVLGHFVNLNLGTSVLIWDSESGPQARLGLSVRYNNTTDTWGWGPGLMASWGHFTVGAGFTRETVSTTLPELLFENYMVSAYLSIFEAEYDVLYAPGESQLRPIQIVTLTANLGRFTLSAAERFLNYLSSGNITQYQLSLQYMFNQHVSAGLLYNYIPGTDSIGTQFFL